MPVRRVSLDGCLTDPEPGMDSRRATVRNVRSKCRCSCVLQFTFRRAVSCVLHRPPSQVIHCTVLSFLIKVRASRGRLSLEKKKTKITSLRGELGSTNPGKGEDSLDGRSYRTQDPGHPPDAETSTASRTRQSVTPRADGLEARGV